MAIAASQEVDPKKYSTGIDNKESPQIDPIVNTYLYWARIHVNDQQRNYHTYNPVWSSFFAFEQIANLTILPGLFSTDQAYALFREIINELENGNASIGIAPLNFLQSTWDWYHGMKSWINRPYLVGPVNNLHRVVGIVLAQSNPLEFIMNHERLIITE